MLNSGISLNASTIAASDPVLECKQAFHKIQEKCSSMSDDVCCLRYQIDAMKNSLSHEVAINWDEIEELIENHKKCEEMQKLKNRQAINRYLRSLIKDIRWDGTACLCYWNDGTMTKAIWNQDEEYFDPEKAILYCIGRKFYEENPNVLMNMMDKYVAAGWEHYYKNFDKVDFSIEDDDWWEEI